ncbi:MAG: sigma-54-dependent Fis family transcriptional regulator [Deltaproteobacteria bacterium]|nr:MAG: sigma-54-dependent Fis family transcriptional regulator [Deltaproteobacteria bacterium]HEC30933.1 sigma-54-dependent Fis family transcriptional regulator [Deltaproteobacteria bacterium]
METILVVDDEKDMLNLLKRTLEPDLNCEVITAETGHIALEILESTSVDLVLADIKMPGMNGLELLERIKDRNPWITVVMMTAYGVVESAVESIKAGAYDFVVKPFDHEKLVHLLRKALERSRLLRENIRLQLRVKEKEVFQNIVGSSAKMKRVFETIQMVAKTDITVLITGESGTGKELAARAIHALSNRHGQPFVPVNCPTLPENILESELFGYKKGAFTHATSNKKGLFEEAHKGTIYLDEIGDISPAIQTKLLRVLQEKEIKPLGQTKSVKIDVRVIASTNRDLVARLKEGQFREDLYYRLNVLPVHMPPLRERVEDIPLLTDYFLKKFCAELGKEPKRISPELMELFLRHPWEGNVRELENIIKRGILFAPEDIIYPADVGWETTEKRKVCFDLDDINSLPYKKAKAMVLENFNVEYISNALRKSGGNVTHAAKMCGMERQALQHIMRRYGIKSANFRS